MNDRNHGTLCRYSDKRTNKKIIVFLIPNDFHETKAHTSSLEANSDLRVISYGAIVLHTSPNKHGFQFFDFLGLTWKLMHTVEKYLLWMFALNIEEV